jgi:exodeoxyribonuclease VII large subunit
MEYSIYELNNLVKNVLTKNLSETLLIKGEISSIKAYGQNIYITLKDIDVNKSSIISCCIWDSNKMETANLKIGTSVIATGKINTFIKNGNYQFNISTIKLNGVGSNYDLLELNKDRYSKLGYFDDIRKKKLLKVNRICIITAIAGAALQDIMHVFQTNNFIGEISVKNVSVQGNSCPFSVVAALQETDKLNFDVILITRGGGSKEDLYQFNDSSIVEQIYKMKTFVLTAIGHEIDISLIDYVADMKVSTPTRAAELLCQHQQNILDLSRIFDLTKTLHIKINSTIQVSKCRINNLKGMLPTPSQIIIRELNNKKDRIKNNIHDNINNLRIALCACKQKLEKAQVIGMPDSYILNMSNNRIITSKEEYDAIKSSGAQLLLVFRDGNISL